MHGTDLRVMGDRYKRDNSVWFDQQLTSVGVALHSRGQGATGTDVNTMHFEDMPAGYLLQGPVMCSTRRRPLQLRKDKLARD